MAPLVAIFTYTDSWTCFAWVKHWIMKKWEPYLWKLVAKPVVFFPTFWSSSFTDSVFICRNDESIVLDSDKAVVLG